MQQFIKPLAVGRTLLFAGAFFLENRGVGAESVHHFESSLIASPQRVGVPFGVILEARNATNGIVADFTGPVSLAASSGSALQSAPMLGNLVPQEFSFGSSGPVSAGFAFTPNADIVVTHARHYSGGRVSIWTDAGVLRATREVADFGGTWMETPLLVPLTLYAGHTYRVTLWSGSYRYYWRNDNVSNFLDGIIGPTYSANSDVFPQSVIPSRTWLVDLRYTTGGSRSVPISPSLSGNFVNGMWTGSVSVLAAAENVRLSVDDGAGHPGTSNPFTVHTSNDVALASVSPFNPLPRDEAFTLLVTLTNTGPGAASSVIVSNRLSGPANGVSMSASQGTTWIAGNSIFWSVGSLASATAATLQLTTVATNPGVVALHSSVTRGEVDGAYENNHALAVVSIGSRPALSVNDVTLTESNTNSTNAILTVQLSSATALTVAVNYATSSGSAATGIDFQNSSGTLVFAPGTTNQTISISVNGDLLSESNEFFFVNLSSATNATMARSQGRVTINDNDPLVALTIGDATVPEGDGGATNAVFAVRLSAASGRTVTIGYQTANGSAVAGSDYTTRNGTLTFPPGITNQPVSVPVTGDVLGESNETFVVNLSNPVNATVADNQGIGTIVNDDPVTISINDATVQEGDDAIYASFSVWLSPPTNQTVVVSYATANGTAIAGVDYAPASGSLIFSSGTATQIIQVVIYGDLTNEVAKTFFIDLGNPVNGTIADSQGVCTITDNDPLPVLSVSSPSVVEGHSGSTSLVFQISLTGATERTATVNYATTDGTALATSDYVGTNGSLTFPPGTTNLSVSVTVLGDQLVETNEIFNLVLSGAVNASVANPGAGTILNDDGLPGQMHHFEWTAIPSPQSTGIVFTAGISARDFFNNPATDFNGTANLFARTSSPSARLFFEDFEDGDIAGWSPDYLYAGGRMVTNQFAAGGSNSLYLYYDHANHSFSNITPSRINFSVRAATASGPKGYFIIGSGPNNEDTAAYFVMYNGEMGVAEDVHGWHPAPFQINQWYKISLHFNWQQRTLDYLVNDSIIETNISFRGPTVSNLTTLKLESYTAVWFDQIEMFGTDLVPAPGMLSPQVTGAFTNGVWAGNLVLGALATSAVLGATNDSGFAGFSNPFEVGHPNDLVLSARADGTNVFPGDTFTCTLTLKSTGPGARTGVSLTNTLPAGATFVSATVSQGTLLRNGALQYWLVGAIPGGSNAVLSIVARADSSGWLTNRAVANSVGPDPNPLNNSATAQLRVLPTQHHFVFNTLTASQQSQIPFAATLTARDPNNNLVTNFNGSVVLSATRLFKEDFEDANLDGWSQSVNGSQFVITNTLGDANNQALKIAGAPSISRNFPNLSPAELTFKVRLAAPDGNLVCTLGSAANEDERIVHFRMNGGVMYAYYLRGSASFSRTFTTDRWYQISFNFNWAARTYSWSVDGALVASNVPFYGTDARLLANAEFNSSFTSTSWWDDFELLGNVATNAVNAAPTTLGPFTNGVWAGLVEVQQPITNVQLRVADSGGHAGLSATFNVLPGPHGVFDHFEWSFITPQLVNQPFAATLTAKDKFGATVAGFSGSARLRATSQQAVRILVLATYSDVGQAQIPLNVISNSFTNFSAIITTNTKPAALEAALAESDVLLVASQPYAPAGKMAELGVALRQVLTNFVSRGGVVIVCADTWEDQELLNKSGLLACAARASGGLFSLIKSTNHILTENIASPFTATSSLHNFYNTNGTEVLTTSSGSEPVVLSRDVGLGHVVLIGCDMAYGYPSGTPLDKVLANAVKWAQSSTLNPLALNPTNSGAFVNGAWTNTFTISDLAGRVFLEADDGHLIASFSNPFSVGVINDIGVTMVLSNYLAIAGEPLNFLVTVTNAGPNPATGVWLTNALPAGTAFVGAAASQGSCSLVGEKVICDAGTMTGGSSLRLTLTLMATQTGALTNVAIITRAEPDFFLGNNTASSLATVVAPTSFYISDVTVLEGNSGVTNAMFEVRVYPPAGQTSLVAYATIPGSALAGLDYVATNGVLTFPPGVTNQFITVGVRGDLVSEDTEMFSVQLSNPTNALPGINTATGAIVDNNDPLPFFYLDPASASEGDAGTNAMLFSARLSTVSGRTVTALFATANGTALAGSDFDAASGTLAFPPGVTHQTFSVALRGNTVNEPDEFFVVNISSVSNATRAFAQSSGLIRNDDGWPGKLDHFELGPALAPVVQNQPFWLSVTARDAWNYALPDVNGPFNLDCYRGLSSNSVEVLTWTKWVSGGRYPEILTAISNWFTDFHETSATTLDPSELEGLLSGKDVLLVPPQNAPTGQMGILGASWSTVLNQFVNRGGVVIVCSDNYDEHLLLANSGFLQLQRLGHDLSGNVTIASASRVTAGVSNSFTGPFVSMYAASNGLVALRTAADSHAVVIQREMGLGAAFMIGSGVFDPGSQMDHVLANAVRWNQGAGVNAVLTSPSAALILTNGTWAAHVTIAEAGQDFTLRAFDGLGRLGLSSLFDVATDSDGDGLPDDWELSHGFDKNDPSDALADADGDDSNNLAEYLSGTDPLSAASVLRLSVARTGNNLWLQFPTVNGRRYIVEHTAELSPPAWTAYGNSFFGTGGLMGIAIPTSTATRFYRLGLLP